MLSLWRKCYIKPKYNKLKDGLKNGKVFGYEQKAIIRRIKGKIFVIKKMWIKKEDRMRETQKNQLLKRRIQK